MAANYKKIRILINTPNYSGGVANHYAGLKQYWREDVRYNIVGRRKKLGSGKYWLFYDSIKFIIKILFISPDVIVLNPSLAMNALKRDYVFLRLASILGKRVLVFFHGFNVFYAKEINGEQFTRKFNRADAFLVLSNAAKSTLMNWGISKPIYLTTTKVEDQLVADFNIVNRIGNVNKILFLARVEIEKGIYIALDTFKLLSEEYPQIEYIVVGDGTEFNNARQYVANNHIRNVSFTGMLSGDELKSAFEEGDLYLFTSYHEGMPASVLEAMSFGLPIVTRPVGGLVDFFEQEKMGVMVDSFQASDFIPHIKKYLKNPMLTKDISEYNYQYAKEHFLASQVARNIEILIQKTI